MLTFLRKIRRSLIESISTQKYLLYAIGEITLVVIGILIALQINNWNEARKNHQSELAALIDLQEEFEGNLNLLDAHLQGKKISMEKWEKFIDDIKFFNSNAQSGDMNDESIPRRPGVGSNTFVLSQTTLNKLIFTGELDQIKNDSLQQLLNSWDNIWLEYHEDEIFHQEFTQNQFVPLDMLLQPTMLPMVTSSNRKVLPNPFQTRQLVNRSRIETIKNIEYQNYVLRNFYWLQVVVYEGEILSSTMETIISLLKDEIAAKQ